MDFGIKVFDITKSSVYAASGFPGCGKTRAALLTAPEPLLINIENRLEGVMDIADRINANHSIVNVNLVPSSRAETPLTMLNAALLGNGGIIEKLHTDKFRSKYKTIIVDSLTMVGLICSEHTPVPGNKFDHNPNIKKNFLQIFKGLTKLVDYGYNVILIMHTKVGKKVIQDKKGSTSFDYHEPTAGVSAAFDRELRHDIKNMFYMSTSGFEPNKRITLQTEESNEFFCRNAKTGSLPMLMTFDLSRENPVGWASVFERVEAFDQKVKSSLSSAGGYLDASKQQEDLDGDVAEQETNVETQNKDGE